MSRALSRLQAWCLGLIVLLGLGLAVDRAVRRRQPGLVRQRRRCTSASAFREIRGVEVGTRVRIQGIDAGEVVGIAAAGHAGRPGRAAAAAQGRISPAGACQLDGADRQRGHDRRQGAGDSSRPAKPGQTDEPAAEEALLESRADTELADVLGQVKQTLEGIQNGEGTLGKLARDPEAYDAASTCSHQGSETLASIGQGADAVKHMPLVRRLHRGPGQPAGSPQLRAQSPVFRRGGAVRAGPGRPDGAGPRAAGRARSLAGGHEAQGFGGGGRRLRRSREGDAAGRPGADPPAERGGLRLPEKDSTPSRRWAGFPRAR